MDSKFNPPKDQAEFEKRAEGVELKAALAVKNSLLQRRASAVRALDVEIEYYDAVIDLKSGKKVTYPPKAGRQ